jgi:hypothetical protein
MSRLRSPNYPQISLAEAVRRIEVIRSKEGRNAASREVLAKLLGFGGLNGASMGVLSAISKYGLLEDAGNKELKVSDLADAILFPHQADERARSIADAASKPALFAEINEKWPDHPPSDESLRSYLIRRGFSQVALDNVIACYRETMELVTAKKGGYDRESAEARSGSRDFKVSLGSSAIAQASVARERGAVLRGESSLRADASNISANRPSESDERVPNTNRIRAGLDNGAYEVEALLVDTEGFDRLIKILQVNKLLFEVHTERFDSETETWSKPSESSADEN